jgi:hypothetical protein
MKEKAKGTERAERAKARTRQNEKVEREQVSKGNAEGAVTDRRKMKQRRGSNHGPSKIERKSEQSNLHRDKSRTVENRQNVQKRSKMVKIDVFGSGEWPAACSAKNQHKVAVKRTCV